METKITQIVFNADLHKRAKQRALDDSISLSEVVNRALSEFLSKKQTANRNPPSSGEREERTVKLEDLKSGQIVYDAHRHQMGNTTMRTMGVWNVRIESVNLDARTVVASWNNNPAQTYYPGTWKKWRKNRPVLVGSITKRIATKAELAAMKEAKP